MWLQRQLIIGAFGWVEWPVREGAGKRRGQSPPFCRAACFSSSKHSFLIPSWTHFFFLEFFLEDWREGFFSWQPMGVLVLISILWCVCLFRSLFISSELLVRCLMLYPSILTPPSLKGWRLLKGGEEIGRFCLFVSFFTCLKDTWRQGLSNSESYWLGSWGDYEQKPLKKARETVPQIQWLLTKYVRIAQKGSKHLPKVNTAGSYLGFLLVRA